jgi:prepilin-type N-terminal cleavage/methylation domain-containing protein
VRAQPSTGKQPPGCRLGTASRRAFTLIELLVVITIIGILGAILLPALSKAKQKVVRMQGARNLHQLTLLLTMYADSNNEKFPRLSSGHWAWDVPRDVTDGIVNRGVSALICYCPANGFTKDDFLAQWNEFISTPPTTNDYRVIGYAMTFPGTACVLVTNQNVSIIPQPIFDPERGAFYAAPAPADRVLTADATISKPGEANVAVRSLNTYVGINGAYVKPHRTAHVNGTYPSGGNLGMLDGHIEWRRFQDMYPRTDETLSGTPVFWW